MRTNVKFGECLNSLLYTLGISMSQLSKIINVDSSLVNRWVNGKRVPAYNTKYIENIAEYLAKNIKNSFQKQSINELFLNVCGDNESVDNMEEKIKRILFESQGHSIECRKKGLRDRKSHFISEKRIPKYLSNGHLYFKKQNNIKNEYLITNANKFSSSVDLSSEDKIIFGSDNILSAGVFLLETAASQECKNNNTIYITYNNINETNNHHNDLIHYRNILLKAINNGWNVSLLLRLNNISRAIRFIDFIKPLIGVEGLSLHYIDKYNSSTIGKEYIVVPGVGALSSFSTNTNSKINCAFYLKNKTAVDIFKNHFKVFLSTYAQPLIKYYPPENSIDYSCYLVKCEENIGSRLLYNYYFSVLTLPKNLYIKLLKKKMLSNDEILIALDFYTRRLNAFITNVKNYEYNDIYLADSINDLIKHRQFYLYDYTGIELIDLEVQDIIELFHNIINLLEAYDNYNIAIMSGDTDRMIKSSDFYCMVKERQAVLLEMSQPSEIAKKIRISIKEPMMIKSFEEYLREIWDRIAPVNKDKKEVITWIQRQIYLLEK